MQKQNGQIHVYTGDGKGKTTAGLGLLVRALGAGLKVGLIFFDKGGDFYSERKILEELQKLHPENLQFLGFGTQRMVEGKGFRFENNPEDFEEAKKALTQALAWFKENFDLLILDEINTTVKTGLLKLEDLKKIITEKPENTELILTGRYCPAEIIDLADLVTNMNEIKHYVYQGVKVRQGIDY
ncbi:cob(I)yrinic acid a,c-diamide adenosyltransferase [Candidatus Nomurabacteria bacterium]|nr:cob(I)yrinic acid a,c-diamide adenosyltransferase [Candidatus Nomurabacteria bacterium]